MTLVIAPTALCRCPTFCADCGATSFLIPRLARASVCQLGMVAAMRRGKLPTGWGGALLSMWMVRSAPWLLNVCLATTRLPQLM